jgi:thioredoxin 1
VRKIPHGVYYSGRCGQQEGSLSMSDVLEVSVQTWDDEVATSAVPVVVDFWAPWCGPCRMVAPELDKLASRVGTTAKFVKVNIDENQELAVRFGVMSIPTIARFEGGQMTAQVVGARGADALGRELGLDS